MTFLYHIFETKRGILGEKIQYNNGVGWVGSRLIIMEWKENANGDG